VRAGPTAFIPMTAAVSLKRTGVHFRRGSPSLQSTGCGAMTAATAGCWGVLGRGTPRFRDDGTFAGFVGAIVDIEDQRGRHRV
jgi:hypothetical protein